jgi:hypothetical protein
MPGAGVVVALETVPGYLRSRGLPHLLGAGPASPLDVREVSDGNLNRDTST